jgi:hypothetical protein
MTTKQSRQSKPRYAPVGATVRSGYWQETYRVLSHNDDESVTVQWLTGPSAGQCRTHFTAFNHSRHGDTIIGE